MNHIFYEDFDKLLCEYRTATTREDKLIKHRLDSIVSLYDNCGVEEREFADEITLEFSRIIALLKSQHKNEMFELTQKYEALQNQQEQAAFTPLSVPDKTSTYEYDREVLEAFYHYYMVDGQLPYYKIDGYAFADNEERKKLVNLTLWDYCNRIKTFAYKYLYEIFPEESIPNVIHEDEVDDFDSPEHVVFVYNNLEVILAKIKTTNEDGQTVKQRLNIRSALRKLNEFKQAQEMKQ